MLKVSDEFLETPSAAPLFNLDYKSLQSGMAAGLQVPIKINKKDYEFVNV
jgi:hypothetical protein